jgi:hypothetical protein
MGDGRFFISHFRLTAERTRHSRKSGAGDPAGCRQRSDFQLVGGEAVEQARTARAFQSVLAAAAA